jgi:methylthioribulose-1-phosphate dehydratase
MTPPPLPGDTLEAREALIRLGRRYDGFGWVLGTGGNLSARTARGFVVTASGRHKGMLEADDFVELSGDGATLSCGPLARPSAEASIHRAIYAAHPEARFALHVHTPVAAVAIPNAPPAGSATVGLCRFEDLEMVKAWGCMGFRAVATMPVFENHADVEAIAADIAAWFRGRQDAPGGGFDAPALLIRTHGVTAWGADAFEANRNLETAEFLLRAIAARG